MMNKDLKPYDETAVCPHCGCSEVGTRHCAKSWLDDHGSLSPHRGIAVGQGHLDRLCQRCGYLWVEASLAVPDDD